MKIFYDPKNQKVRVKIETPEDLIHLKRFITQNSFVTAETMRSKEIIRGGEKIKVGKEKMRITVEVEKIEVKENSLKVLGKIIEATREVSGYHSLELKPGVTAEIRKHWKKWEIEKLKKLAKPVEKVLACVMDERETWIYIIGDRIEEKARIHSPASKFSDTSLKTKYFSEIFETIKNWEGKIVIAGPGFAKEDFFNYLKEKGFDMKRVFIDSVSHTGISGVNELLKRRTLDKIIKETRISEEVETIEKFFEEIAKNGLVVYGEEEVKKALELGALEKLLISIKLMEKYKEIIDKAEEMKTEIMLISDSHPSGEKFYHFCGIGGFLRYRIE